MSEPTREEKIRTIKAARKLMENLIGQHATELREYIETQREFHVLARGERRPQRQQEPQENPAEQQRLRELLDTVKNQKETK